MIRQLQSDELVEKFARSKAEEALLLYPFSFQRAHFVFEQNGRIVGRISANQSLRDSNIGYVGMFSCDLENQESVKIASDLFDSACRWLKSIGVKKVYGPVDYSTLFSYRFELNRPSSLIDAPLFFWEPTQPPEYVGFIRAAGFEIAQEYHSRAYAEASRVLPISQKRYDEALKNGFSFRSFSSGKDILKELETLSRINARAFDDGFLTEPFDEGAYRSLLVPQYLDVISDYSFFILNPEGHEIGYFFLFEEQGYLIWKTLAIIPEYQGMGLAGLGIHHALQMAQSRGLNQVVSAMIRKGAPSEALLERARDLMIWEHRYAVFHKVIST
jgi:GNAT superfamily N-acetyltransferase